MADWTTIASLATAGGTLVLAVATSQRTITYFVLAPRGDDKWMLPRGPALEPRSPGPTVNRLEAARAG
jgi:hypothetical protein